MDSVTTLEMGLPIKAGCEGHHRYSQASTLLTGILRSFGFLSSQRQENEGMRIGMIGLNLKADVNIDRRVMVMVPKELEDCTLKGVPALV